MSDKMREEFLDWYNQQEQFGDAHQEELWKTWKASRENLVVNLPKPVDVNYHICLLDEDDVKESLFEKGIKYK